MEKGRSKVNAESGTNKANRASSLKSRVSFMAVLGGSVYLRDLRPPPAGAAAPPGACPRGVR